MRPDALGDPSALDPTGRFSDRVDDYVKYRPDYPAVAIDAVLEGLGDPAALVAADVGAGTGISSRQLADRGPRVLAVEPNAVMRGAAAPHARVEWRDGTAEATGLDTASVGLVTCFQAFHWFRVGEAATEFRRVLRPGGRLALVWNVRDDDDALTLAYWQAIRAIADVRAFEDREIDRGTIHSCGFTRPDVVTFPHTQRLTRDGFIGRAASASYVPKDPERFGALVARLDALHAQYREPDGMLTMRYLTDVWRATAA
jgi:SAM-dependent methyltransferase